MGLRRVFRSVLHLPVDEQRSTLTSVAVREHPDSRRRAGTAQYVRLVAASTSMCMHVQSSPMNCAQLPGTFAGRMLNARAEDAEPSGASTTKRVAAAAATRAPSRRSRAVIAARKLQAFPPARMCSRAVLTG